MIFFKNKPVINYNSGVKVCDDVGSQNMMDTSGLKPVRINETIAKLEGDFEVKMTIEDWKVWNLTFIFYTLNFSFISFSTT